MQVDLLRLTIERMKKSFEHRLDIKARQRYTLLDMNLRLVSFLSILRFPNLNAEMFWWLQITMRVVGCFYFQFFVSLVVVSVPLFHFLIVRSIFHS